MDSPRQIPDVFIARRNFFNFFGIACRVLDMAGALLFFVQLKAFKLKEDISVYLDESMSDPILRLKARQILDISAAYDVMDIAKDEKVGVYRRKGLKSMLKDEWEILNPKEEVIGTIKEDSWLFALMRRFLSNLIPQNYHVYFGEKHVGEIRGTWNPFLVKYTVDMSADKDKTIDRRLVLAGSVLLMTIEGKQG